MMEAEARRDTTLHRELTSMARSMMRGAQGDGVVRLVGSAVFTRLYTLDVHVAHVAASEPTR